MKKFEQQLFKDDMDSRIKDIRKLIRQVMEYDDSEEDRDYLECDLKNIENRLDDMSLRVSQWKEQMLK